MRHGIAGNKLSRNKSLRKATVRDIAKATLIQQRICTTKAKAKESRKLVDKLITMGKKGTLAEKRRAFSVLCDHKLVSELFSKTAPRFKERSGGYTRIITLGHRRGDNAELVYLELTEKEVLIVSKAKTDAKSKERKEKVSVTPEPDIVVEDQKKKKTSVENKKGKTASSDKKSSGLRGIFNRQSKGK